MVDVGAWGGGGGGAVVVVVVVAVVVGGGCCCCWVLLRGAGCKVWLVAVTRLVRCCCWTAWMFWAAWVRDDVDWVVLWEEDDEDA